MAGTFDGFLLGLFLNSFKSGEQRWLREVEEGRRVTFQGLADPRKVVYNLQVAKSHSIANGLTECLAKTTHINEARHMGVIGDGWLVEARVARARPNRTNIGNNHCACQGL